MYSVVADCMTLRSEKSRLIKKSNEIERPILCVFCVDSFGGCVAWSVFYLWEEEKIGKIKS